MVVAQLLTLTNKITPYQAFEEALGTSVDLRYSEGARILRNLRPLKQNVVDEEGSPGFTCRVYMTESASPSISNVSSASYHSLERPTLTSVTITGTFTPTISGSHSIS